MNALSLRARLSLWCVLVVLAVVALFAIDVLLTQQRIGLQRFDQELEATRRQLAEMMREELNELDTPALAAEESLAVISSGGKAMAVLTDSGQVLRSSFERSTLDDILSSRLEPGVRTIETRQGEWRVHANRDVLSGIALQLIVASPTADLSRDQREIREAILLGIPITLVLAAAGGLALASLGLRPITQMAGRAASLPLTGEADLGPAVRRDEIGQLTNAFNALVARLRTALRTQQQFMADASHELRSPVSVIRTAADVALCRAHRDEPEYREALAIAGAQARALGTLVDDMLVLARADSGGYPLRPVELYLDDVVEECRRAIGVLAADRQITVHSSGASDVSILGDEDLLRRLLFNLLQNAVQHTPRGGTVSLDVTPNGSDVQVRVTDTGAGIAEEDRARVFDRFVQLDPSRRSEGAGLGLTIAKWIAEVHGGSLALESTSAGGTTFCARLPTSPVLRFHPREHPRRAEPIPEHGKP